MVRTNLLEKFYVCRKCDSKNIKIVTEQVGGSQSCYKCPNCGYSACNPRKMWKVRNESAVKEINKIYDKFSKQTKDGLAFVDGYAARLIVMGWKLKHGQEPFIRDVKKIYYKNGKFKKIK